jgi:ectoine hydroxylase-related dioxygenase (phytanoyl-CoA dioxygenase family)
MGYPMVKKISSAFRKSTYLIHPLGLVGEVILFQLRLSKHSSKFLITTFLLLGGLPGTLLSKLVGKKRANFGALGSTSLIQKDVEINNSELKANGYSLVEGAISKNTSDKLLALSLSTKGSNRGMDSGKGYKSDIYFNRANPDTVRFDVDSNELFKNHVVQELACDPRILQIAQDYLGTLPVLDFVAMWWHTKSPSPDKEAAQYFHFDMERLRWIKFFFYITDVTKQSGPHIFVPKSHLDNGLPFSLRSKGYTRLEDSQVGNVFPQQNWKVFTGPVGSMIVEDTRGLHKGKHVENGDRLVFQLQYTSSLFGKTIDKLEISQGDIGEKLTSAMQTSPLIFQQVSVTS